MSDPMDVVARCAPSAEAAERITRVAARMAYFDGAGGMLTMPEAPHDENIVPEPEGGWCEWCGMAGHTDDDPHPPEAATDNAPWACPECEHRNEAHAILCHGCGWDSAR